MTDVERLTIDYAAKASVNRESVEAYSAFQSREMRIAAEVHQSLANDYEIIAAALLDKAEREKGCEHCLTLYEDGESWENGEPHELRIDGQSLLSYGSDGWEGEQVQFCPWCGKDLTGGAE